MKKIILVVAAFAVAAPAFAGTGGNPKPKDNAPDITSNQGGDRSHATAKTASPKSEKPATRSGN